jgi:hypothetical protein
MQLALHLSVPLLQVTQVWCDRNRPDEVQRAMRNSAMMMHLEYRAIATTTSRSRVEEFEIVIDVVKGQNGVAM